MLEEHTLTEQKAVSMIRQSDCVNKQSTALRMAGRSENVQSVRANPLKKVNAKKHTPKLTQRQTCRRCGNQPRSLQQCPAKDVECYKCKCHFSKCCEAKMTNEVKIADELTSNKKIL